MRRETVAGESIGLLRAAIAKFECRTTSDGMFLFTVDLARELGDPLFRAVTRIEEQLLAEDVAQGDPDVRTVEQRRADALVLLVERVTSRPK
jgi:hypothetical protein